MKCFEVVCRNCRCSVDGKTLREQDEGVYVVLEASEAVHNYVIAKVGLALPLSSWVVKQLFSKRSTHDRRRNFSSSRR